MEVPDDVEGFGMVFLEAMASGVPTVSTNTFAIPEILGGSGICIDVSKFSWYGKDYLFAWKSWEEFEKYCESQDKPDVVDGLVAGVSKLIENPLLGKKIRLHGTIDVFRAVPAAAGDSGAWSVPRPAGQVAGIFLQSRQMGYSL